MPVSVPISFARLSLTLAVLTLPLAACDREAPADAQQQGELGADKQALTGEIDRSYAGTLMPVVEMVDPAGNTLNTGALQGQPVLLNMWATWCAPCVVEMPMLDRLAGELGDSVRVVVASQDMQGAKAVEPFFAERDFQHLEPWIDSENQLGFELAGGGLPVTVLFDASGREVFRVAGGYEWDSEEARAQIVKALGQP